MSTPIFQRAPTINPYAEALQTTLGGINQLVEQDAINRALARVNQGKMDPLTAILGTQMPAARQQQLLSGFQEQAKLQQQQAETQRKSEANALVETLLTGSDSVSPGTGPAPTPSERENLRENPQQFGAPQTGNLTINDFSDSDLLKLSGHQDPRVRSIADTTIKMRNEERKAFREERKFSHEANKRFEDQITDSRDDVRNKEYLGKLMLNAIDEGDMGFFSGDNIANKTGIDLFRTAKGQQLITAGKEYFLSNINRAGSRPNQWIEQQIQQAMPQIGTSPSAQKIAAKILVADNEVAKEKIRIRDEIAQRERNQFGFVPQGLEERVEAQLRPIADDIQLNLAYDLRKLRESELSNVDFRKLAQKKVVDVPLTPAMLNFYIRQEGGDAEKAIQKAKRLGYIIPNREQFIRWDS